MKKGLTLFLLLLLVILTSTMGYKNTNNQITHVGLIGDVMIGRSVNTLLRVNPYHNLWGTILPVLRQQDVIIANLETAITTHDKPVPKVFNFKIDPEHMHVLHQANIGIVNLANNHILDYNLPGLYETLKTLKKANIAYVGAGMNESESRKPYLFTLNNIRFAILGATDNEPSWAADLNTPGTNYIDIGSTQLLEDIQKIRPFVDIVIVTLHWGPNMREYPSHAFVNYAHDIIEAGADLIAGHSAHIVQGIELYNGKFIIYDMGDFIDDYVVDPLLRNDLSALFSVSIQNKRIIQLTIIPTRIENMVVNKADKQDAQRVFDLIQKRSLPFKTIVSQSIFIEAKEEKPL